MSEKQSNKERIKEITAGIEKGIMELFESDRYRNYLTTMSRFHRYSLNNVMLIHAQRPDATLVAGFSKWKNSFGRHVKKGEKGIQILAPTPYKIKVDKEMPSTGRKSPQSLKSSKISRSSPSANPNPENQKNRRFEYE